MIFMHTHTQVDNLNISAPPNILIHQLSWCGAKLTQINKHKQINKHQCFKNVCYIKITSYLLTLRVAVGQIMTVSCTL